MTEINYNIVSLIDFLGLTQGIVLGIILIFSNHKNRPSLFLGLFLITFSSEMLNIILLDTKLLVIYPNLLFLPFDFYFLSPVLLYLYAKSLIKNLEPKDYWLLLPGIVEFTIFSICFLFSPADKLNMYTFWEDSLWYLLYSLIFLVFVLYFIITIIRLIRRHQIQLNNYFSDDQNKKLKWVKFLAWYQLAALSIMVLSIFMIDVVPDIYMQVFFSLINVVFIYWVSVRGLRQPKIELPSASNPSPLEIQKEVSDFKIVAKVSAEDKLNEDYQYLLKVIDNKKPFKDPELTLSDLARITQMPIKKLSHIINQKASVNFNTFINQYRIEEAKKMLTDPAFNHLNVVGVGYEVGFNSKATFYKVFKKITATTPAKFKKTHLYLLEV